MTSIRIHQRAARSGFFPILMVMALGFSVSSAPRTVALARIPISFRPEDSAVVIGPNLSSLLGAISIRNPVSTPNARGPFGLSNRQPAATRVFTKSLAKLTASGSSGYVAIVNSCPAKACIAETRLAVCSPESDLHAISFSSLILASLSPSATAFASSALALASAIAFTASSRALSQCASLTLPAWTTTNVASTPAIRLPSRTRLATSESQFAVSSGISENNRIPLPGWLFWGGITVVICGGAVAIWCQITVMLRRRRGNKV